MMVPGSFRSKVLVIGIRPNRICNACRALWISRRNIFLLLVGRTSFFLYGASALLLYTDKHYHTRVPTFLK